MLVTYQDKITLPDLFALTVLNEQFDSILISVVKYETTATAR